MSWIHSQASTALDAAVAAWVSRLQGNHTRAGSCRQLAAVGERRHHRSNRAEVSAPQSLTSSSKFSSWYTRFRTCAHRVVQGGQGQGAQGGRELEEQLRCVMRRGDGWGRRPRRKLGSVTQARWPPDRCTHAHIVLVVEE